MTTWASGYVADVEYTSDFYGELAPAFLQYVCLMQGVRPPRIGAGATYCELGCGQGVGTSILAASNPEMQFWGIDFNPAQIANAQRLAGEGGLTNVRFLDDSFEEALARPEGTFPKFDYIVLHGIYSWVNAAARQKAVEFLGRHLAPGGVVYISYNLALGWSDSAPLQRLFREHARRHPGRSDLQAKAALEFSKKLAKAKAGYFMHTPSLAARLDELGTSDPNYLAHEYLNEAWHLSYHADVVSDLESARLNYVGSATLIENIDKLTVPPEMIPLVQEARDPVWRETLRDFARNQKFRRDVFMRGATYMKPVEHSDALAKVRIALMADRDTVLTSFKTAGVDASANQNMCTPILDALAERQHTIGELAAHPALRGRPGPSIVEAINVMMHRGHVHPVPHASAPAAGPAVPALNKVLARRIRHGELLSYIAMPGAGTGKEVSYVDLMAILAIDEGLPPQPDAVAEFAWKIMERTGQRILKDKKKLEKKEETIAELKVHFATIYASKLALWRALGVI